MGFDDLVVDGEAKSGARGEPAGSALGVIELSKQLGQRLGFDADSVVSDVDLDHVAELARRDHDRPAVGREPAGIR